MMFFCCCWLFYGGLNLLVICCFVLHTGARTISVSSMVVSLDALLSDFLTKFTSAGHWTLLDSVLLVRLKE